MGPDWCLLPPELLKAIAEKITSLADYIRFRAVCRPWLFSCSPRPRHLPLQLPWLMLPYQSDGKGNDDSTRLFYDLSASKIHKLDLPETCGVDICGSSHGWLVLQKGQVVSLLNPITHATIPLPPFTGPPSTIGIVPFYASHAEHFFENWDADADIYAINPTDNVEVCKAILTSSPLDPSCLVFVLTVSEWLLAFCKIGDEHWTVIEFECHVPLGWNICDFTYNNGFLYTVDLYGPVRMYNLNNPSRTLLGGGIDLINTRLVEGVSGDILFIHDGPIHVNGVLNETEYTMYKLSNTGEPKCIKVMDIGENVLFVDGGYRALSLSSANLQLPEWGANCLCYDSIRKEQRNRQDGWTTWRNHNIKLAKLDDGMVIDITGDLGSFQVNEHWQKSLWLTPSLL